MIGDGRRGSQGYLKRKVGGGGGTIDIRLPTLQPFTDAKNKGSGKSGRLSFDRTRHALTTGSQS